jgi:hypothetical protein
LWWSIPLCLAAAITIHVLFGLFDRPHISVCVIFLLGALIFPNYLGHLPEAEWNHASSLPLRPVLEYVIDVLPAKVVVLPESYLPGQIFWIDVIASGPLQF